MPNSEHFGKDKTINLTGARSWTDGEWSLVFQFFYESLTPLWFKWVGWVFALGGITYLSEETGSISLRVIQTISYILLIQYFAFFFGSIRIEPYDSWSRSRNTFLGKALAMLPSLLLSFGLWAGSYVLIGSVIEEMGNTQP